MAEQILREVLGDALLDLAERHRGALSDQLQRLADWLGDVAQPPPGVELRSVDGSKYTGVGVFDHNRLVILLAVRHEPAAARREPPGRDRNFTRPMWSGEPEWFEDPYYR